MPEEALPFTRSLNKPISEVIGDIPVTRGDLSGKEIFVLESGIGKVNAALSTASLIINYRPKVVISAGTAGGLHPDVKGVVVSNVATYGDVDLTAFGRNLNELHGVPKKLPAYFDACDNIVGVKVGEIVTLDRFVEDVSNIKAANKDAIAVDMESASIAHVCWRFGVPFVSIRAISDNADLSASEDFTGEIDTAAELSYQSIMKLLEVI